MQKDKIAVLDFGGQYAHLIANRIRRLGVYSEIFEPEVNLDKLKEYKGIILSGGPMSVYGEGPTCDPGLFDLGVPVMGICYGHQLMQHLLGGKVEAGQKGETEYGLADVKVLNTEGLFKDLPETTRVWMSHGDTVKVMAEGFEEAGQTKDCANSAVFDAKRRFFGVQFHPEVTHSLDGMKMLDNFLSICEVSKEWSIDEFIKEEIESIKDKVGDKKVFLLCSGGVDSTVAFALLEKALGKERVYGLLVDTGLMRLNEADWVKEELNKAGFTNLHVAKKGDFFLEKLAGKSDPEEKRKIIGDLFLKVKEEVASELNLNDEEWIMGQGTIYPDTIETGGTKHADTIKTHHNRVDKVQKMIEEGKVIEPLAQLYKDEVRDLGEKLGLPHELVWRHPFPGPGLGVRLLCASASDVDQAQNFDELSEKITNYVQRNFSFSRINRNSEEGLDGRKNPNLNQNLLNINEDLNLDSDTADDAYPEFQVTVLPVKSVGVQGDGRTYRHPAVLFTDCRDWDLLEQISTAVTNQFAEVNRVVLSLTANRSPLTAHFNLKESYLTEDRVKTLQMADDLVTQAMKTSEDDFGIWQFPVVLAPVSTKNGESIVLRPIVSTEAMTASFARIDWNLLDKITAQILEIETLDHVFYDLTHKPPGTIEWE